MNIYRAQTKKIKTKTKLKMEMLSSGITLTSGYDDNYVHQQISFIVLSDGYAYSFPGLMLKKISLTKTEHSFSKLREI